MNRNQLDTDLLDKANPMSKLCVLSYIQAIQRSLDNNIDLFQNIPSLIYYLCLSYYPKFPFNTMKLSLQEALEVRPNKSDLGELGYIDDSGMAPSLQPTALQLNRKLVERKTNDDLIISGILPIPRPQIYAAKAYGQKIELIVFGFVKRIDALLLKQTRIPSEIISMCLSYYCSHEYFIECDSHLKSENNQCTIIHDDQFHTGNAAYGNLEINNTEYIKCAWYFQIHKSLQNVKITIGIDDKSKKDTKFYAGRKRLKWTNNYTNSIYRYGYETTGDESYVLPARRQYGCCWTDGDIVTMELNIKEGSLKYYVNSKDKGVAHENIDFNCKTYVMVVYLDQPGAITLINFEAIYARQLN